MANAEENKLHLEYSSQRFADRLFRRFPAWKQYLDYEERTEAGLLVRYLDIHVPSQNPKVPEPLNIVTMPHEVLVSWWGGWHVHFGPPLPGQEKEAYLQAALDFLDRFTSDDYVVANYYRDGTPTGSGFGYASGQQVPEKWFDSESGQVVLRSWLGGRDREVN